VYNSAIGPQVPHAGKGFLSPRTFCGGPILEAQRTVSSAARPIAAALAAGILSLIVWKLVAGDAVESSTKLKEVSVFTLGDDADSFTRGQIVRLNAATDREGKAYPAFKSDKPIYGSVRLGEELGVADSGTRRLFVIDESGGAGKGYDRLYMDLNGDLDLSNDAPITLCTDAPEQVRLKWDWITQQAIFNTLSLPVAVDGGRGFNAQLMPRLALDKEGKGILFFVNTKAHTGTLDVHGASFDVILGEDYVVGGQLDRPSAALHLKRAGERAREFWWGADRLKAFHSVNGVLFKFSATPAGDELTARPYTGELGLIEVCPGPRKLAKMLMRGSLDGPNAAVAVGEVDKAGALKETRRCALPVGDYRVCELGINYGALEIEISNNYHSDGKPLDMERAAAYPIAIRKGKPFVLDFANKPEVLFASPARGLRLKPGDTLSVKAVLTDPKLDLMIRRLDDASVSLDPKVLISRGDGKPVAEGVMPFG